MVCLGFWNSKFEIFKLEYSLALLLAFWILLRSLSPSNKGDSAASSASTCNDRPGLYEKNEVDLDAADQTTDWNYRLKLQTRATDQAKEPQRTIPVQLARLEVKLSEKKKVHAKLKVHEI